MKDAFALSTAPRRWLRALRLSLLLRWRKLPRRSRSAGIRFTRFGAVGGAGFVVNEAALFVVHRLLHAGEDLSWFLAFIPSVTFTWWGNRVLTFADRASPGIMGMSKEWGRFVAANSIGAIANFATYALLIRYAPSPICIPYIALGIGVLIGLVFNFTLSHTLVFKK